MQHNVEIDLYQIMRIIIIVHPIGIILRDHQQTIIHEHQRVHTVNEVVIMQTFVIKNVMMRVETIIREMRTCRAGNAVLVR